MKRFAIALGIIAAVSICIAQIVPPAKNPPFFGGEKKGKKDDEGKGRSLSGAVKDENDGPAEGAIVQLKDTKTLQVRSYITKENGTYHFHGLNPNVDYELKAEYQGASSSSRSLSSFDTRKAAVVNLKLDAKK